MSRPIAYTYDADYHTVAKARRDHPSETIEDDDGNGVSLKATDSEGNPIHPVFPWDEIDGQHLQELEETPVHRNTNTKGSTAMTTQDAATLTPPTTLREKVAAILKGLEPDRVRTINRLAMERGVSLPNGFDPNRPLNPLTLQLTIEYDLEHAPTKPQWEWLADIGIDADTATDAEIIEGLAAFGCFVMGSNHLDDEAFAARLRKAITDSVPLMTSQAGTEWIDLGADTKYESAPRVSDRDRTLPRPGARS